MRRGTRRGVAVVGALLTIPLLVGTLWTSRPAVASAMLTASSLDAKSDCAYTGSNVSGLTAFSQATGHDFTCAVVFNNGQEGWTGWDTPWAEQGSNADLNWAAWKAAVPGRRIVLTEDMVPSTAPPNWREIGATGAYDPYARILAQNLVAHGLGDTIIRLGHEANYPTYIAGVGKGPLDWTAWVQYWRDIVTTMRAVPGANFVFEWNVNSGYQRIPFAQIYPGDAYVDIISIDQYDDTINYSWNETPQQHWTQLCTQSDGLDTLVAFADAHQKALAFSEWAIQPGGDGHAMGDDPYYIDQMAALMASQNVAYQAYFAPPGNILQSSPNSWSAYLSHFGGSGDLQGPAFPTGS